MWRSKKVIVLAVLSAVLLLGSLGGIALANTGGDGDTGATTIFDRVAAILVEDEVNITSDQLKDAFAEVRDDVQLEALKNRLYAMVEEEKITQSEADQYLEWWQARPEGVPGFGLRARDGFHRMGRMRGFGGFGGPCAPQEPAE